MRYYCVACKGLADPLVGMPLEQLVLFLHAQVPALRWRIVGGLDPHPLFEIIVADALEAHKRGEQIIFLGHSMGGMATFYMADRLHQLGITSPLFVGLDATDWASNAPHIPPWSRAPANEAGRWYVPNNIDRFLYFHQDAYPGGGRVYLAPHNEHTKLFGYHLPHESHISIVNAPIVKDAIEVALKELP